MKPLSERNPIAIAIAGLVLLGLLAFAVFDSANLPIIGGGTGYTAYFPEAAGLQAGNEVRVAGVIVGLPIGIGIGRWLWTLFAQAISAAPDPNVPVLYIAAVAFGTVLFANLAAVFPGIVAARTPTALLLRTE